jgi:choline dehydrogenase-like flavoprotein
LSRFDAPVIIGTGPSGIACAYALIERGIRPVMIDGGNVAGAVLSAQPSEWIGTADAMPGDLIDFRSNPAEKTWFGSSFATEGHPGSRITYDSGVVARQSNAVGGLSRIWGGTFAFFRELDRWPDHTRPDEEDLSAVRELVPHALTDFSDREQIDDTEGVVAGSAASARVMRAFCAAHGDAWDVEHATVAIDTRRGSPSRCSLDGTCLDGCAADAIWYAGDQLRRWVAEGRVTHISGRAVDSVAETKESVRLVLSDGHGSETITAPRVYVAAGGIGTGALLVRSGLRDQVILHDTATAFAGVLDLRSSSTAERRHHGLSQWWARSSDGGFLAQMYPPDPGNARRLAARLPALSRRPGAVAWCARRLHPVVAYIGSENSDTIRIAMAGGAARVHAHHSLESKHSMRARLRSFSRALLRSRSLLPVFAAELSTPGTGYHFGSSLPHGTETDWLGRLAGLRRIYIVDSSVLPSLEIGSITPTVMANAVRIGRHSAADAMAT